MTITPGTAVERHGELLRSLHTPLLQKVFRAGMRPMMELSDMTPAREQELLKDSFLSFACGVSEGETILVTDQAIRLMKFAADSLDKKSLFDLSVVPVKNAVVWFAEPLEFSSAIDSAGREVTGFCDGFVIHCWETNAIDPPGEATEIRKIHSYFFLLRYEGDPPGSIRIIAPLHMSDGMEIGIQSEEDNAIQSIEKANPTLVGRRSKFVAFNPKPLIMALWSLASQPIISDNTIRPIEPGARAARKKLSTGGRLRVLSLRQRVAPAGTTVGSSGSGGSRHFTHQWIVRGFWRNQRYGPKRSQIKRVWIDAYVKGPADAPLVVSPRVYVVRGDG